MPSDVVTLSPYNPVSPVEQANRCRSPLHDVLELFGPFDSFNNDVGTTRWHIKKLACFMKAALFLHCKDIPVLIPFISDVIHEVFDQMDSKTTRCAFFKVVLQIGFLGFQRIERLAVILHEDIQDALCGCNRDFYEMIGVVVKAVG
jgi:hypothetical protein